MPLKRPTSRRAFTLVELIVVIGILAVLLALFMPALSSVRRAARRTVCESNLREISLGHRAYVTDNEGRGFEYWSNNQYFWMQLLQPYSGKIETIGICPNASEPSYYSGSANTAWGPGIYGHMGSFAYNGWLYRIDIPGLNCMAAYGPVECGPATEYFASLNADSAGVPLFTDSIWVDAWPKSPDAVPANLYNPTIVWGDEMGRVCTNRHGAVTNVAFVDGHCETIPARETVEPALVVAFSEPPDQHQRGWLSTASGQSVGFTVRPLRLGSNTLRPKSSVF